MTMTRSRRPAFSSALMLALNIGIVVVRKAENPTMSGLCSSICSMNFSADVHAEVDHREAGALEHDVAQVLADVVHVALDGAHQERADRRVPVSASSGRRMSSAPCMARAAISISGTKKSPRSNRAPTSSSDGISAS